MSERLRVLIVGGGIGGLALAALLRRRDVAAEVVELAPDVRIGNWVRGRVALLGDAAHSMTPNLGQGAAMAIEDAAALAELLAGQRGDPALALRRYEARRRPRVAKIQESSWRFGAVTQWQSPAPCALRNLALLLLPDRLALSAAERLLREGL